MANIAPLSNISNSLDTIAKFVRVMEKEGVSFEDLLLNPINDMTARRNLAEFVRAGCPARGRFEKTHGPTLAKEKAQMKKTLRKLRYFLAPMMKEFVVRSIFVRGKMTRHVSIAMVGRDFEDDFFSMTERDIEATELWIYGVHSVEYGDPQEDDSHDLSGFCRNPINLAHFHDLLAVKQELKDFIPISAPVRNIDSVVKHVHAHWFEGEGWYLQSYPVMEYAQGNQVVSF